MKNINKLTLGIFLLLVLSLTSFRSTKCVYNDYQSVDKRIIKLVTDFENEINYQIDLFSLPGESETNIKLQILSSKARVKEITTELNEIAKIIGSDQYKNPYQYVSTSILRGYHHELIKTYAQKDRDNELIEDLLVPIESALKINGCLPNIKKADATISDLLQKRFDLVEELNRLASLESRHLIDASPLIIETKEKITNIYNEIIEIDRQLRITENNLPKIRELFTNKTRNDRIETLKYGKQKTEQKICLQRNYNLFENSHLATIIKYLKAEQDWLEEKHIEPFNPRGPPIDIEELYSKLDAGNIEAKKKEAYKQEIKRLESKFKAAYFSDPRSQPQISAIYEAKASDFSNEYSYLTFLAKNYYQILPYDPVEAETYKTELSVTLEYCGNDAENPPIEQLLGDQIQYYKELIPIYDQSINAREKQLVKLGDHAPISLKKEIKDLKEGREMLINAKNSTILKIKNGGSGRISIELKRTISDFPKEFSEQYCLKYLNEQRKALERMKAWGYEYPSLELNLNRIKNVIKINTVAKTYEAFYEYSKVREYTNIFKHVLNNPENYEFIANDNFNTRDPDILSSYFNSNETYFAVKFDEAGKILDKIDDKSFISEDLINKIKSAKQSFPESTNETKAHKAKQPWRLDQDIDKIKGNCEAKSPGGIWLTPDGIILQPYPTELPYTITKNYEKCNDNEIMFITDNEYIICLPYPKVPVGYNCWLNNLQPW